MTDDGDPPRPNGGHSHDHEGMLTLSAATDRVRELRRQWLDRLGSETVPIGSIGGRTLTEPIHAPEDRPARSRSTMDGYAFDADDGYPYELLDVEVFPENDPPGIEPGEAVRVFTGASIPPSANAVLKQEEAAIDDEDGSRTLSGPAIDPGTYVYERGSNAERGERLFEAGEVLGPKDTLFLGDLGIERVTVRRRLSVGVLATGTEIHEGRQTDLDSPMLEGLVRAWGHEPTYEGTVPDEYDRVRDRIAELAESHDVVLTTGGTSVGRKDYVVRALSDLGEVLFHRVRLRPGKPIAVAELDAHDTIVFAIPGKPVGAHAVTTLVAGPFFTGRSRRPTVESRVARDVGVPKAGSGFTYAIPVTLSGENGTESEAMPLGHADSALSVYEETFDPSVLSSSTRATRADGIALTQTGLNAGESVDVVPYPVLER